ncbi:hypothetical protein [Roseobacter ponti]|uniref:Uncharacterized protein n=1 Tax=Roseobacter ponti TaxID=1891787 RepID=A0A858SYM1_9RHOB|nr:hypothetical protein [Roseobacter ponti]QJF52753.1 hypothetical protein G3256_17020 [Roseobacter ponti]
MRLFILILCICLPGWAASEEHWVFGDWRVHVRDASGDHICTASTGGGGASWMFLRTRSGDTGPPWRYPVPVFGEYAGSGGALRIRAGDRVVFDFGRDGEARVRLKTGEQRGAGPFAEARPEAFDVPWMLGSMRAGDTLRVYRSAGGAVRREHLFTASLNGFTAAYEKMLEACGYRPAPGVPGVTREQARFSSTQKPAGRAPV